VVGKPLKHFLCYNHQCVPAKNASEKHVELEPGKGFTQTPPPAQTKCDHLGVRHKLDLRCQVAARVKLVWIGKVVWVLQDRANIADNLQDKN
jgi:hypothetical protein